jgi:hypothetical protein
MRPRGKWQERRGDASPGQVRMRGRGARRLMSELSTTTYGFGIGIAAPPVSSGTGRWLRRSPPSREPPVRISMS